MIFSNRYLALDLYESLQTTSSANLHIKISRKNVNYYNREGVVIVKSEFIAGEWVNESTVDTWITAYNPESIADPGATVESNTYESDVTIQIDDFAITNEKRYGTKTVKIELFEGSINGALLFEGQIDVRTLDIPLPVIHSFVAETIGKQIRIAFEGVNPNAAYTLNISNGVAGGYLVENSTSESLEYFIDITDAMYKNVYTFTATWYAGGTEVLSETQVYITPNFALGLHHKKDGVWVEPTTAYIKVSGVWKKIAKPYKKLGGIWTSQE